MNKRKFWKKVSHDGHKYEVGLTWKQFEPLSDYCWLNNQLNSRIWKLDREEELLPGGDHEIGVRQVDN